MKKYKGYHLVDIEFTFEDDGEYVMECNVYDFILDHFVRRYKVSEESAHWILQEMNDYIYDYFEEYEDDIIYEARSFYYDDALEEYLDILETKNYMDSLYYSRF